VRLKKSIALQAHFVRLPASSKRPTTVAMRSFTTFSLLVAASACVKGPSTPKVAPPEHHVASGLQITLDGKDVEPLPDGAKIAGRGADPFTIVATTKVDRHPYPREEVIAILTSGEHVVRQVPFAFDAVSGKAKLIVPGPGTYRLEIWEHDHFIVGNTFVAASLPALDGKRSLELHQDAGPKMLVHRDAPSEVVWRHWDALDKDEAFVAEWWKNGARVSSAGAKRSDLQREVLARVQNVERVEALGLQPAWKWTTEKFPLPDTLLRSEGHWELRVYRDDHGPVGFSFDVDHDGFVTGSQHQRAASGGVELEVAQVAASRDATRALAKLPHTKFEAAKKFLLPVTVAEARALTRSEVLRNQRVRLNALSHQGAGGDPSTMQFGGKKDDGRSPLDNEAKQLVASMQKLIAQLGDPWTDEEKP
jgi:hypothetical protein